MKKLVSLLFSVLVLTNSAYAEINWELVVGGMYLKQYGAEGIFWSYEKDQPAKGNSFEAQGGLLMQIPVSKKSPWSIETGLMVRSKLVLSQSKDYKFKPSELSLDLLDWSDFYDNISYYRGISIDLPLKAFYRFRFNVKNSIDVGVGPYVSVITERGIGDPLSLGLTVSAAYRYRALSVGFSWLNPIFINGPRDYYNNSFCFNIGINFGKKAWSTIGTIAVAAGSVAGAVSSAYMSTYDTGSGNYSEGNSTYESTSYQRSGKAESKSNFSLSQKQAADKDRQVYNKYVTMVQNILRGDDTTNNLVDVQNKMSKLRLKWANTDYGWPKSDWETRRR